MLNTSLKKDLIEIDKKVLEISTRLRDERIQLICEKLGIENNYNRFGLNPGVNNIRPIQSRPSEGAFVRAQPLKQGYERKFSEYQQPMMPENRYTQQNLILPDERILGNEAMAINLGPTLGLSNGRYQEDRIFQDPNVQVEFERKMAARQNAMWPSRRIEELRMLTLNHLDH